MASKVTPSSGAVLPDHFPAAVLPFENPKWDTTSKLKGETDRQRAHANEIISSGMDTSVDGPWTVNDKFICSDYFKLVIAGIFLVPQLLVLFPLIYIALLVPVSLNLCYVSRGEAPLEVIRRDTWSWMIHCAFQWILSIPAQAIAFISLVLSLGAMSVAGTIFCTATNGWGRWWRNKKVIAPHASGPGLYWHFGDCVAASAGMVYRQGLVEFTKSFALMFILNPWIKYWITGNIWVNDLDERFITQVGRRMDDMEIGSIDDNFRKCISRAKNIKGNRGLIDEAFFCPHYPYPPQGRRYAIGMQHAGKITTFVHTTHFRSPECAGEGPIAAVSTSVELPVYRVMLWRNNPYHIFTGFVEASITNGKPSQPDKKLGAEHPMWLVNSHDRLAADRGLVFSIGWIDRFFDQFIPIFQYFIRYNVRGKDAAEAALAEDPKIGFEDEQAK